MIKHTRQKSRIPKKPCSFIGRVRRELAFQQRFNTSKNKWNRVQLWMKYDPIKYPWFTVMALIRLFICWAGLEPPVHAACRITSQFGGLETRDIKSGAVNSILRRKSKLDRRKQARPAAIRRLRPHCRSDASLYCVQPQSRPWGMVSQEGSTGSALVQGSLLLTCYPRLKLGAIKPCIPYT